MTEPAILFRAPAALAALALTMPAQLPDGDPTAPPPSFRPQLSPDGLFATVDGGLAADGNGFRARFDTAGARIEASHPADPATAIAATFRLVNHGRRGAVRSVPPRAGELAGRTEVRYRHTDIVERYRTSSDGFEQSFVLARRPAGDGDYVIGIAVSGDGLQLPVQAAAHQALLLRHDGHPSFRYGEAVAFARGGEPVAVATRCDGAGRIELIVPGAFLDRARYPVVVDPAVGPVILPAGSAENDSRPDVAYSGARNRYLFVWQRTTAFGTEIRGRLYTHTGTPISLVTTITSSNQCQNPTACALELAGNEGFMIAYECADRIRARFFGMYLQSLVALRAETDVTTPPSGARDRHPSICGGIRTSTILTFDRTPAGSSQPTQILARHVYGSPILSVGETVLESVTSGYVRNPRIAKSLVRADIFGQLWRRNRIVWERFYPTPAPGDFDLRTTALQVNGTTVQVTSPTTSVAGAASIGPDEHEPDIAVLGAGIYDPNATFLIAWNEDDDIKAHAYTFAGPVGSEIDVRSTSNNEFSPAVGAGRCDFSIGYLESIPPNEFSVNVRAARLDPVGVVTTDDRPVDVLNGPFQGGLRSSSVPLSTPADWRNDQVMMTWWGQTGPAGGVGDVRARIFVPVNANTYPFGTACPGPNGELPEINDNGVPIPGNVNFQVMLQNAPTNSLAVLLVGDVLTSQPVPGAPGCQLYMGLPALDVFAAVTNQTGFGYVSLPIPCGFPPGVTLAFQWGIYTPGHNAFGWITSDDLDVAWTDS